MEVYDYIFRYDVRIHMDVIPDYSKLPVSEYVTRMSCDCHVMCISRLTAEEKQEETKINYERYRSVIINEFNNGSNYYMYMYMYTDILWANMV